MKLVLLLLYILLGLVAAYILLLLAACLPVDKKKKYTDNSPFYRFIANSLAVVILGCCRVRIRTEGLEGLPEGRYLLVCNHRSNFDPIVMIRALRDDRMIYVSKPDNFSIPVIGSVICRCGFLPIDRSDARSSLRTLLEAAGRLGSGEVSVAIYPEGTRSKSGELLPFHDGVFKVAKKADTPVAVLALEGTEQVHKRAPWRHTDVTLRLLEVIPVDFVRANTSQTIGERARADMEQALGAN